MLATYYIELVRGVAEVSETHPWFCNTNQCKQSDLVLVESRIKVGPHLRIWVGPYGSYLYIPVGTCN